MKTIWVNSSPGYEVTVTTGYDKDEICTRLKTVPTGQEMAETLMPSDDNTGGQRWGLGHTPPVSSKAPDIKHQPYTFIVRPFSADYQITVSDIRHEQNHDDATQGHYSAKVTVGDNFKWIHATAHNRKLTTIPQDLLELLGQYDQKPEQAVEELIDALNVDLQARPETNPYPPVRVHVPGSDLTMLAWGMSFLYSPTVLLGMITFGKKGVDTKFQENVRDGLLVRPPEANVSQSIYQYELYEQIEAHYENTDAAIEALFDAVDTVIAPPVPIEEVLTAFESTPFRLLGRDPVAGNQWYVARALGGNTLESVGHFESLREVLTWFRREHGTPDKRFRAMRESLGWTQEIAAQKLGYSFRQIQRMEHGHAKIRQDTLMLMEVLAEKNVRYNL